MWKFVTRGIRETLERRATCRTNVYSQTSQDGSNTNNDVSINLAKNQKFLIPKVDSCNNGFCGSAKTGGPNDKKNDSKWDAGRSWTEAFGWSSVLAVGWVVCQSLCLRGRLFERSNKDKWQNRSLRFHGVHVPLSFIESFNLQPKHIFPVINCIPDRSIDNCGNNLKHEWTSPRPYGPITIEEALQEAKDDYTRTHRIVMGEFELRFGVKAVEEKRYKDAIKHFSTGANLSSSGSMFNLGLCHELGIGTVSDTRKAAKYYRDAAEKGHPDAMYNLGVFHAQGRGGLNPDIRKARELFTEAANLGQAQARIALDLEKNVATIASKPEAPKNVATNFVTKELIHDMISSYDDSTSGDNSSNESSMRSSYYSDDSSVDSVQRSTDIFLNALGIQTNTPVPIFAGVGD